jgi:hypothetical protein
MITLGEMSKAREFVDITKEYEDKSNLFKQDYVKLAAKFMLSKKKTRVVAIV